MTVNDQKASPDIRIPEIDTIKNIEDVKLWMRQFRHEWESAHRETWRDTNNVYVVELPAIEAGAGADFDIPLLTDVVFTLSGSNGIQWTAGTVRFGGTTFTVNAGNVDPATAVYIDISSLSEPVTLGTLNGAAVIVNNRWYVSNRDGSTVYTVLQSPIMHAGLLQANTVTATTIDVDDLFAEDIVIQPGGNIRQGKTNFASTIAGFFLGDDSGTPKLSIGDAARSLQWNGSSLTIVTDTGTIGSSTDFFDISNGQMQLFDNTNSTYIWFNNGEFSLRDTAGGSGDAYYSIKTTPSTKGVQETLQAGSISGTPGAVASTTWRAGNGNVVHNISCEQDGTGVVQLRAGTSGSNKGLILLQDSVDSSISYVDIRNCVIESTTSISSATSLPTVTVAKGGTNIASYTTGDILYASSSSVLTKLNIGSTDDLLTVSGGIPSWTAPTVEAKTFTEVGTFTGNGSNKTITITGATNILGCTIKKVSGGTARGARQAIAIGTTMRTWAQNATTNTNTTDITTNGTTQVTFVDPVNGVNTNTHVFVYEIQYEK